MDPFVALRYKVAFNNGADIIQSQFQDPRSQSRMCSYTTGLSFVFDSAGTVLLQLVGIAQIRQSGEAYISIDIVR